MATYEDDNGEPRFGKRLSPEELAAYLREQEDEQAAQQAATEAARRTAQGATASPSAAPSTGHGRHAAPSTREEPTALDVLGRTPSAPSPQRSEPTDPRPWASQPSPSSQRPWQQAQRTGAAGSDPDRPWVLAPGARPWAQGGTGRPRRRWGLLITGLVLLLVVPMALFTGAVYAVVDGHLASGTYLSADGTVSLDAGTTVGLYSTGTDLATCTATGPSGKSTALTGVGEGVPYRSLTATAKGDYTLTCTGGSTTGIVVGPAMDASRLVLSSTLMAVGGLIGIVGLALTIAGGIRAARGAPAGRRY